MKFLIWLEKEKPVYFHLYLILSVIIYPTLLVMILKLQMYFQIIPLIVLLIIQITAFYLFYTEYTKSP